MLIAVGLWAAPTSAQSRYKKLCDDHDPKLCVQAVLKGELVPFDGQLYTPPKAVQQAQKAHWCDRETDYAVRKAQALADARLKLTERIHVIDLTACEESVNKLKQHALDLHKAQAEAARRSWTESPTLWFAIGAGTATIVLFGGAQLANMVSP